MCSDQSSNFENSKIDQKKSSKIDRKIFIYFTFEIIYFLYRYVPINLQILKIRRFFLINVKIFKIRRLIGTYVYITPNLGIFSANYIIIVNIFL